MTEGLDWLESKKCPVCGKTFEVLWPKQWRYRRDQKLICSWSCLRKYDRSGKGGFMKMITEVQKKKAVEIAIGGGDPLTYLKELGSGNPSAHWSYIRKQLRKKDPEQFKKLPEPKRGKKKAPEVVLTISAEELDNAVKSGDIVQKVPVPSVGRQTEITKPANYDGLDVMAVRNPETGFRFDYDPRYGIVTWRTIDGDEVCKTPEEWRNLAEDLAKVFVIFGI